MGLRPGVFLSQCQSQPESCSEPLGGWALGWQNQPQVRVRWRGQYRSFIHTGYHVFLHCVNESECGSTVLVWGQTALWCDAGLYQICAGLWTLTAAGPSGRKAVHVSTLPFIEAAKKWASVEVWGERSTSSVMSTFHNHDMLCNILNHMGKTIIINTYLPHHCSPKCIVI